MTHENASHFEANTERNDVQNLEKSPKIGKKSLQMRSVFHFKHGSNLFCGIINHLMTDI